MNVRKFVKAFVPVLAFCAAGTVIPGAAEELTSVTYGIYSQEGDSVDSLLRITLTCDENKNITDVKLDDALIPYSVGGAEGWAELDEDTAALLGEAVLSFNDKNYPSSFKLGDIVWTGSVSDENGVVYSGAVNGSDTTLMDYIVTEEGGAWYYEMMQDGAKLLDASGAEVADAEIGTKESINHGVDFWASEITFPGNIEKIIDFIKENGIQYGYYPESDDIVKNEDGVWEICDVVSIATLAGTPNYLNLAKEAYEKISEQ